MLKRETSPYDIKARIAELRAARVIQPADAPAGKKPRIPVVGKAPGIVKTFLAERD
jgi:hypothetical protein